MCSGTPRDTYGDVPGLLARYRDAGPSIRRAKASGVLVSQSTIGFLGFSEGGNENAGVSGVSLTGCSFFVVRGSPAEPQTVSLGSGAGLQRSTQRSPIWVIRAFITRITIPLRGRACLFFPLQGTAARPSSLPYSPDCLEGKFSEVRIQDPA